MAVHHQKTKFDSQNLLLRREPSTNPETGPGISQEPKYKRQFSVKEYHRRHEFIFKQSCALAAMQYTAVLTLAHFDVIDAYMTKGNNAYLPLG